SFTTQVTSIFSRGSLDEAFLKELSTLLIAADTGVKTTNAIIQALSHDIHQKKVTTLEQAKIALEALLVAHLSAHQITPALPRVLLLVGVNGSGKTTFIAKYVNKLTKEGKKVLVVAGDTFRAAATQQLETWCNKIGAEIFIGRDNQDPASVIFDACKKFTQGGYDHLVIDTAGRLQSKTNLMKELAKIRSIIDRHFATGDVAAWLTIDAMLGQNSLQQATIFHEATPLSGLVLTKLDGTGKGGTVFAIVQELKLPIVYVTFGENLEDMSVFDAQHYVKDLLQA
ncbi:MAG: signal recognition particle-docking protein FtsY, partial [Candidatus Babeliales bacterium]